jgi:tetratricopeptide (TPR) repeat protein
VPYSLLSLFGSKQRGSIFTNYVVEGLEGKNGQSVDNKGNVTPDTLYNYVAVKVMSESSKQIPKIVGVETQGYVILARYPDLSLTTSRANPIILKGNASLNSRGYSDSLSRFSEAVKIDPDIPEAWTGKGLALCGKGLINECQYNFVGSEEYSSWAEGYKNTLLNLYEEAKICFDKALNISPNLSVAWIGKGKTLAKLGQFREAKYNSEEAIKCLKKVSESDYNVDAWTGKGIALNNLKMYEEAKICFDKALDIDEFQAEAWQGKSISLRNLGQHEESEDCLSNYRTRNPLLDGNF